MADESREIKRLKHLAAHVTPQSHYGKPTLASGLDNEVQIRWIYERGLYVFVRFNGRWYAQRFYDFFAEDIKTLEERIKSDTDVYSRLNSGVGQFRGLWNKAFTQQVVYVNDGGEVEIAGAIVFSDGSSSTEGGLWYDSGSFYTHNGTEARRICDFIKEGTDVFAEANSQTLMANDGDIYIQTNVEPPKITVRYTSLIYNQLKNTSALWTEHNFTPLPSNPQMDDISMCTSSSLTSNYSSKKEYGITGSIYPRADYRDVVDTIDVGMPTVTLTRSWTDNTVDDLDTYDNVGTGSSSTFEHRTTNPGAMSITGAPRDGYVSLNASTSGCTEDNTLGSQLPVDDNASQHTCYFVGFQMWGKITGISDADAVTFLNGCGYVSYVNNSTLSGSSGGGIGVKTFPSSINNYISDFPSGSGTQINISVSSGTYPAFAYPSAEGSVVNIYDDLGNNIYNSTSNTGGYTVYTATYTGINAATTTMKIYRSNNIALASSLVTWFINDPDGS